MTRGKKNSWATRGPYSVVTVARCIAQQPVVKYQLGMETHPSSGAAPRRHASRGGWVTDAAGPDCRAARAPVNAVDCKQDQEIRAEWNDADDGVI